MPQYYNHLFVVTVPSLEPHRALLRQWAQDKIFLVLSTKIIYDVESLTEVKKYIITQDFPEAAETLFELAEKNNFRNAKLIFRDQNELFGLFCFTK